MASEPRLTHRRQASQRLEPADISVLRHTFNLDLDPTQETARNPEPALIPAPLLGKSEKGVTQSVDRALQLLEMLSASADEMKLQDIAALMGLSASTCHHLLNTLVARRYVARNPKSRTYLAGPRIMELARMRASQFDFIGEALPYLKRLNERTREAAHLAVMDGTTLSILTALPCPRFGEAEIRREGIENAAHATAVGKAILAWLPEMQVARVVGEHGLQPLTSKTINGLGDLLESLRQIRRYGFAIEDEEFEEGVVGIGTAFRDSVGAVIGAVAVAIPAERADQRHLDAVQREVIGCAVDISRRFSPFIIHGNFTAPTSDFAVGK